LEFNLTDGSVGSSYFLGAFMGMFNGNILSGTYQGSNYDSSCTEQGFFSVNINPSTFPDISGVYNLQIQAQKKNCDDASQEGSLPINIPNIPLTQLSTLFGGAIQAPDVVDSLGNQVGVMGMVNSGSVMIILLVKNPASSFYRISLMATASGAPYVGQVMGWMAPNPMLLYQTCDIEGSFMLIPAQ